MVKGQPPSTEWVGRARRFVDNLQVHSIAATPSRLLVTTIGNSQKLVSLDEQGNVGTFTFEFTADPQAKCYVAISPGWNESLPAEEVWVTRDDALIRLSSQGDAMTVVATLPPGQGDIVGLCFDHVGTFEYALLVLSQAGHVYALASPQLPLEDLGYIGAGGCAPSVASPAFGTHAGNLVVSYPEEDVVRGMDADGLISYVVGWSGVTSATTVPDIVREYGRSNGAFFVALGDGRLYRFEQEDIMGIPGDMLVASRYRSGNGVVTPEGVGYSMRGFSRFWGSEVCTAVVQRPAVTVVDVEEQNGAAHPTFVQGSSTLVPVTLLSSPWFWPDQVDFTNVTLAEAAPVAFGKGGIGNWVDMNDDGTLDLTLYFRASDMQAPLGNVNLPLVGQTMASESFQGDAEFTVVAP